MFGKVFNYGGMSGLIAGVLMFALAATSRSHPSTHFGEPLAYVVMLLAALPIFVAIRRYRSDDRRGKVGVVPGLVDNLGNLIEGAAEGKGLGHRFLRHIERNPVLLFLIPADSEDHKKEFEILLNELKEYNPELLDKKMIIAVSKSDMLDDELKEDIVKELPKQIPHIFISSITQHGLTELKDLLWKALN